MGFRMSEIHAPYCSPGETQFLRPGFDLPNQLIEFCMHTPDHTDFTCFLPEETATLQQGARLAQVLQAGMTIFLEGDLGAGKTTLTRGILRGLGFAGRVKSPTYTLVESYTLSSLYFYHFDLYRFNDPLEWEDAGLREYFNAQSLCLIEWADKAEGLLPPPDWIIRLAPEGEGRRICIESRSTQGETCLKKLNLLPST